MAASSIPGKKPKGKPGEKLQILFSPEIPALSVPHRRLLESLAHAVTATHAVDGQVQLILSGDEYLRHLNATYRGQNKVTDVLSFDLARASDPAIPGIDPIGGEIYLSLPRAQAQAEEYQVPLIAELARLLVHGLLHLAGYEHDTPDKLRFMERETDRFLQAAGLQPVPP